MYLVELRPGKEELYRSTDELAAAIRSGDVDRHSRIYHRATSKWISVTLHPQFKAIVAEQPSELLPPLERASWTFFNAAAESLAGADPDEPAADTTEPPPVADHADGQQWRRPLALCITGGFLILGMQLATSGPRPPWARQEAAPLPAPLASERPASATLPASRTTSSVSLASTSTAYRVHTRDYEGYGPDAVSETAAPAPDSAAAPVDSLPAAPRIKVKRALREALVQPAAPVVDERTVDGMLGRWSAAHDSARARLESGMRVARLNQLFSPTRLSPTGGVNETRMSLAGVANFIRVYRQQQVVIDRQYQDSFAVMSKQLKWTPAAIRQWYAKPRQSESPALAALTSSLIDGIDSLLGVLDAQAGSYTLTGSSIIFEDPAAAREYAALRQRISATVDSAKAAGGSTSAGPMADLLQAIGTTRLPQAAS